ncbi:MAG: DNA-formamidopyrimidine glycosylase [Acidobacteria bacterium]|nr:DNA-formamidopyrimidine glycosylase [Acidobacteriota bacterium]
MPELPEVETVCRALHRRLPGCSIRSVEVFRPRTIAPLLVRQFCRSLRGAKIASLKRRGKYLVFHFASPRNRQPMMLLTHLRMTGNLCLVSPGQPLPSAVSLLFHLSGGKRLVLDDRRGLAICQLFSAAEATKRLSRLGVEPLSSQFTPQKLFEITRQRRLPIKVFLLEQHYMAGLGNVYAVEALFRARIHPKLLSARLSLRRTRKLHQAIVGVLKNAVKSAVRGYRQPTGLGPGETFRPQVYGREGEECRNCGSLIHRCILRARSTFYCQRCQRM